MRITWKTRLCIFSVAVFVFTALFFSCPLKAAKSVRITSEVTAVYERGDFGEPGHDPFSKGNEGFGYEERNRGGSNGAQYLPPGVNDGENDKSVYPGSCRDMRGILELHYKDIVLWIVSLI